MGRIILDSVCYIYFMILECSPGQTRAALSFFFFLTCAHLSSIPSLPLSLALSACLFVISKEDLDRQPVIAANLEAIRQTGQLLELLVCQVPSIQIKVALNALLGDRLGNHVPAVLDTPLEQTLLWRLALGLGYREQGLVLIERRVGTAQARVACHVDSLILAVLDQLGRRVVGVQLDLIDSGDDLFFRVSDSFCCCYYF
jgi:hypothetical protein